MSNLNNIHKLLSTITLNRIRLSTIVPNQRNYNIVIILNNLYALKYNVTLR